MLIKKQSWIGCLLAAVLTVGLVGFSMETSLMAQDAAAPPAAETPAAPAEPAAATMEQRIFDLEKYVTNGQAGKDGDVTWKSNIAGPGPGHNAWQMVSTALVLFMTLPGLALFYGGLVRSKNVLSVFAQCFGIAANAFMTTTLAAATAGFVWALLEWVLRGTPSVLGFCSGIVAGLVVITPGAGFVTASSAVIIGVLAGIIPFLAVAYLKKMLGYDDALDTFGIHGIGGTLGAILTGVFADEKANSIVAGLKEGLLMNQLKAVALTIVWSVVATAVIAFIVKMVVGLKVSAEVEQTGLDQPEHGESGYEMH